MRVKTEIKRYGDGRWERIQWRAVIFVTQWMPIGLGFYKEETTEAISAYGFNHKRDAQAWADQEIARL